MQTRYPFHSTFSKKTLKYIDEKSKLLNISKGQVIDNLVEMDIKRNHEIKQEILKEITKLVLTDYYKRELVK